MQRHHGSNLAPNLLLTALAAYAAPAFATNGHVLHGVGSVNGSMGGAGIATSIDAIGSNHNNVSSISFLERSAIEIGAELFIPDRSLSSSVSGAASGSVDSETRAAVIPSLGVVYKLDNTWTLGLTALGIGGFGVDYPGNLPNGSGAFSPVSAPQAFGGFGAIYSNYQFLQVTPSVSYQLSPNVSLGAGVNIDWASLAVEPWPATPPNASGYPTGTHDSTAWGAGFTVGATYKPSQQWALGLVIKSPQWFEEFSWNSQFPDGTPTSFDFRLDYPLIVGGGASYRPTQQWLVAADVKWINYSGTRGFEEKNFASSASGPFVQGFGWEDIWTFSVGTQYELTPRFAVRAGYNYGENPIPTEQQFFNVFAPAIVQHHLGAGFGYKMTSSLDVNVAYYHAFENEESGPFISGGAPGFPPVNQPVPGTEVNNRLSEDSVSLQLGLKF
jgi:long-chain fatty acid transport protein